ncbi:multiheme c-type cytochrome [Roseibium sp.]|uniref:multiheme c-type cytochrome n=1 Tax=Roseibium sp. TaxID=1936156 RepID=UPI003BAC0328
MSAIMRSVAILLTLVGLAGTGHAQDDKVPQFVGTGICADCHEAEVKSWQKSHHALAWTEPSEETVDGDFENAEFVHDGRTSRFFKQDGAFFIETDDFRDGTTTFKVAGVGGIAPLQQYLIETEPGRLQSFDVVWDQVRKEWYHLYPSQELPPEDGFHWSGPYKNWNARCAECHSTDFRKNYSLRDRQYQSAWSEIGVGCEACHGPGEAHVAWAKPETPGESAFSRVNEKGLLVEFSDDHAQTEIQQCATCHARREPFQASSPFPGTPFHDAYRLALLREGLYHPDGQILDEVYVYGSFLQSKMHQAGVRCSDCHEPHSAELRADGNAMCTQCHSPAGNSNFPSLTLKDYDDEAHHFHETGSEGAQCISCHMIERTYMGIDGRRDHSFRVPRPDVSSRIGTPNACTDCHQDKPAEWAAEILKTRFPDGRHRKPHFGEVFSSAREGTTGIGDNLLAIANQPTYPAIVRATALDLLMRDPDPALAERAGNLLDDPEPLVRSAAVATQRNAPAEIANGNILRALEDPARAVRIAAARQLLTLPPGPSSAHASPAARTASREWQQSLAAKSDFPETHMSLGGTALAMRNPRAAASAFEEVTRLDPQLVEAWIFLVRIHLAQQDLAAAEFALQKGLVLNPDNEDLLALKNQYFR